MRFQPPADLVQRAIDQVVEPGVDAGVQAAVYQGGKLVMDAVVGVAVPATSRDRDGDPWREALSIVTAARATTAQ
jgi:hypothetical protein